MNKPRIDHNGANEPSNRSAIGGPQDIFYANSNIVPLPIIERAEGIYMWDEEGNEYIDASSGPVVSNIGHGNRHVADAVWGNLVCLKLSMELARVSCVA